MDYQPILEKYVAKYNEIVLLVRQANEAVRKAYHTDAPWEDQFNLRSVMFEEEKKFADGARALFAEFETELQSYRGRNNESNSCPCPCVYSRGNLGWCYRHLC